MEHEDLIVSMKGIQKSFGGVHALTDGELTLRKGEVLGLIGENGAGKSTLMKILSGVYQADAGVMLVDGKEVHYHEPRQALHDGICMIYQELNLVQHLSVGDNIFIGRESQKGWKLDRTKDNRRAEELLKELELDVSPNTTVSSLTVAKQQMIEIAKGISYDSKVLIMDEPTAALSINEIKDLFRVIQKLKAKGISIIYISHRLEELFEITDRITVMRDGAFINCCSCYWRHVAERRLRHNAWHDHWCVYYGGSEKRPDDHWNSAAVAGILYRPGSVAGCNAGYLPQCKAKTQLSMEKEGIFSISS